MNTKFLTLVLFYVPNCKFTDISLKPPVLLWETIGCKSVTSGTDSVGLTTGCKVASHGCHPAFSFWKLSFLGDFRGQTSSEGILQWQTETLFLVWYILLVQRHFLLVSIRTAKPSLASYLPPDSRCLLAWFSTCQMSKSQKCRGLQNSRPYLMQLSYYLKVIDIVACHTCHIFYTWSIWTIWCKTRTDLFWRTAV